MNDQKTILRDLLVAILLVVSFSACATPFEYSANDFGFSPDATGVENVKSLQKFLDQRGNIILNQPEFTK